MPSSRMINEMGNKYGSLIVIDYAKDKDGRSAWLCQCDCGNTKIVRGSDLRKNKITHCSRQCPCKVTPNFIDETNNKYGLLTVMYRAENSKNNKTRWHCKCECGNEVDILAESLRQGLTSSCGCISNELNAKAHSKDLTNQRFGYLIPLEMIKRSSEGNIWRCKCECGCNRDDILVSAHRLLSKNTQSCGRLRRSHGEIAIENFLKENNINFQQEYSFENLYTENNQTKLRFDFALFKNNNLYCLVEFDGAQHFQPIEHFGGEEKFQKQLLYDNMKNKYCKENNIPLLRIKYDDNIELKLQKFLKEYFYDNTY